MAYSEAQKRASRKYNEKNYKRINMYLSPEEKEAWQAAADMQNISLNEFIKRCVNNKISYDKGKQECQFMINYTILGRTYNENI